ncbi:unnamed protein product [Rotaria socialis]
MSTLYRSVMSASPNTSSDFLTLLYRKFDSYVASYTSTTRISSSFILSLSVIVILKSSQGALNGRANGIFREKKCFDLDFTLLPKDDWNHV